MVTDKICVSIIIPNYNHAQYLRQRIDSVLNQTYKNWELIILDDCSTDESKDIIEDYRFHPKISKIIYNKKNSGSTFIQWEKGIALAKGEFIWIAESDDWCENYFLEELINPLIINDKISFSYAQSYCVDADDNIKWISTVDKLRQTISGNYFIKSKMVLDNTIYNASMVVFRKQKYLENTSYFKEFLFCGDWLFWIEMANENEIYISGKIINYFRKHKDDVSSKFYNSGMNFKEELLVLFYLYDKSLISKFDFFDGLYNKYKKYRINRKNYSLSINVELDFLFYKDKHTIDFYFLLKLRFMKEKIFNRIKYFIKLIFK